MENISKFLLKHKYTVLIVFAVLTAFSVIASSFVKINYQLSDYLPSDAPSTVALNIMDERFDQTIPNLSVYIEDVTIPEALEFKTQLLGQPGVKSVLWLDDVLDVYTPLEMQDAKTVESWYKNGTALFSVTMDDTHIADDIRSLRAFIGSRGIISGDAANQAAAQSSTANEIPKIILFVVPLVLIILLISTSSWFEPVLFLLAIGVAVLLNMGTNVFLGEVSFVTNASSGILQLAVSMDYAVFLLHSFARYRHAGDGIQEAMSKAMVESFSSIAASAATTVIGFAVLVLMRFRIGADMGVVLAKGILFSFISVMVLLPVMAISTTKLMDRTHHRPLLPKFEGFGRVVGRVCIPIAIIVVILIVPGFLGQKNNQFIYGSSGMSSPGSQEKLDAEKIESVFGKTVQMVLLVPEGDVVKEKQLGTALDHIEHVTNVISYANYVGAEIPQDFLNKDQLSQFRSGGYSRMILYVDTPDEGKEAFDTVNAVRATASDFYPGTYQLVGQSVVNYDLMDTIVKDNRVVNVAVVLSIGLVLLLTFRSLSIPLILLLVIEGATWINLSLPYFTGDTLNYLGYQIISSVQLGATVDYGILFATHYMANRRVQDKYSAIRKTVADSTASILTPAAILTIAGMMLGLISSNGIISQLGAILGRGAALSAVMVLTVLPGLFLMLDTAVHKTTLIKKEKETLSQ